MRLLATLLFAAALTLVTGTLATASCRPPVPLADQAAAAVSVIHGTVTAVGGGALTVRVDRVLKGEATTASRVFVGPGRGGAATSVDYTAGPGSEQVLYLTRSTDGELETNACLGNHAGPVTNAELAHFGAGRAPAAGCSC